jgi:hypothetical protein
MRKVLCRFVLVFIGLAGLAAVSRQASAEISCTPNITREDQVKGRGSCRDSCKVEKDQKRMTTCIAGCDASYEVCNKRREEKEREAAERKSIRCHDPVVACMVACHKESHDEKKCEQKCGQGDALRKYQECLR